MCRLQMKSIERGVRKSLHNLFLTLLGQMSFSLISVHAVQNCLKLGAWAITLSLCVELFVISTVTYICIVSVFWI